MSTPQYVVSTGPGGAPMLTGPVIRQILMTIVILSVALALMFRPALASPVPNPDYPPPETVPSLVAEPPGSTYARSFFPPSAVNGECSYPRPARNGEQLRPYLKLALSWTGGGRFVLDLDCIVPIGRDGILSSEDRDPVTAYVQSAWRWLHSDQALRGLTLSEAAEELRLREARKLGFADGYFVFGRKAEALGYHACALQASGIAMDIGLLDAATENHRAAGGGRDGYGRTCAQLLQ